MLYIFFPYVLLKMKFSVRFWRPAQKWERRVVGEAGEGAGRA